MKKFCFNAGYFVNWAPAYEEGYYQGSDTGFGDRFSLCIRYPAIVNNNVLLYLIYSVWLQILQICDWGPPGMYKIAHSIMYKMQK